jgi:hypothetical protein
MGLALKFQILIKLVLKVLEKKFENSHRDSLSVNSAHMILYVVK